MKKFSVRETISALDRGESIKILYKNASYANVYVTAKRIEKNDGKTFIVSEAGSVDGTNVTRIA